MREMLVRYLLGELDSDEQARLERELQTSAELRRELEHLKACFAESLDSELPPVEPPRGLAERTSERIAELAGSDETDPSLFDYAAGRVAAFAGSPQAPSGPLGWSFADLTVAAGVCLAMGMLLLPALRDSRDATRRTACANNLGQFYFIMAPLAERKPEFFLQVNRNEFAGMAVYRLVHEGDVDEQHLRQLLVCRNSPLGEAVCDGRAKVCIPDPEQLRVLSGAELAKLFRTTSGSYDLPLGYVRNGQYYHPALLRSNLVPVMSDGPDFTQANLPSNQVASTHHRGGLNVLHSGGCVKFQASFTVPASNDGLFTNDAGFPAAGRGPHDTVLVPGDRKPTPDPLLYWPQQ